ncbi:MAG: IS91 family transposase [Deltaproteobacteria bacterium]|nr:MAG: IS91 family transposase [Deltaproteobacteria bacterium]RLB88624.1 MAG: IS91 family transposase [Deltaproteobacteria bacterium]
MRGSLEVADIFRAHGPGYREAHGHEMPPRHLRAMRAIELCRTAELGGHVEECDQCGAVRVSYNSCRNRHCPKCQCLDKERWLEARKKDLLPTQYFHLVFTIPESLRPLALRNQNVLYPILFRAASETLKELAADPKYLGAEVGFITILHTWSQTLIDHPHLHCIVTGGGLSPDGKKWIPCKKDFFIPVKVISRLFRGKFLAYLKEAKEKGKLVFPGNIAHLKKDHSFKAMLDDLYDQEWVVYCKPPFSSAETVMDYLGRYTHRVAISNDRLIRMQEDQITFRYRNRNDNNALKSMTLDAFEFIRRFLLHILPDGFMKIRYYGILSHRNRKRKLALCKKLLGVDHKEHEKESWQDLLARITGIDPRICPCCGKGKMVLKEVLHPLTLHCRLYHTRRQVPP